MTKSSTPLSRQRPWPTAALAGLVLLLLAGCASVSVGHLQAKPWNPKAPDSLVMKYWSFEFTAVPAGERYGVKGRAVPVTAALPAWADRIEALSLVAYLRDSQGNVLDSEDKDYLPMPLPAEGVPFDFFLTPSKAPQGSVYVSFGYKAEFTSAAAKGGKAPSDRVFFANEGALIKR